MLIYIFYFRAERGRECVPDQPEQAHNHKFTGSQITHFRREWLAGTKRGTASTQERFPIYFILSYCYNLFGRFPFILLCYDKVCLVLPFVWKVVIF